MQTEPYCAHVTLRVLLRQSRVSINGNSGMVVRSVSKQDATVHLVDNCYLHLVICFLGVVAHSPDTL